MEDELQKRFVADSTNKDVWLDARMSGVTASDVANFVEDANVSALVYKKLNNTFKGNKWTDWGLEREEPILEQVGFPPNKGLFKSLDEPRFMATPDGFKYIDGELWLCQVKTTSKPWDVIPENYIRQCQWEMYIMGAAYNLLVWEQHQDFIPVNLEPMQKVLKRDNEEIERLIKIGYEFLNELDKQKEGI
jgi:hypothetical protein